MSGERAKRTIHDWWDGYRASVIPKDAPEIQIMESRRAFYGGFGATLRIFDAISDDDVSEDEGVAWLETDG
jgi:hypothetical protein